MNEDISIILKINGKEPDKTTADAIIAITYIDNDDEHADDLLIITTDNSAFAKGDRITLQIVAEKWRGSNIAWYPEFILFLSLRRSWIDRSSI